MEFRDLKTQYQKLKPKIDAAVFGVLDSSRYIMGAPVAELEKQLADYAGVKHCVACGNGTDALQLALMAWNIGRGDLVFVSDICFFASAEVIALTGAMPVFVDIDPETFNMDVSSLEQAIKRAQKDGTGTPKAVIAVNLFGQPADYTAIRPICAKYGLKLLEDAAQGFGGRMGDKRAGSFGDIAATSFFPSKPLGCYGDGGAVFTDHDEWAAALRSLRVHGKSPTDKYDNVRIGLNSRLDTIQAAVLQVKLEAFEEYELQQVNNAAAQYTERLRDIVQTPVVKNGFYSSWAQYSILLEEEKIRDGLKGHLASKGIPAMIFYPKPLHAQRAFGDIEYSGHCPVADDICKRILSLPIHPYLAEDAIESVAQTIKKYLDRKNI